MHELPLITTVAAAFSAAWLLGLLTQRLRLSPIVGYLLAGILIGPHTPGFVGDIAIAQQLAEVGVILLMFGVGLHFHVKDLFAVKGVAIPGAIGQSLVATILSIVIFGALGVPLKTGAVIGMAMAVASTVVLMRVLLDAGALNTYRGHVAVGWLIIEDIFTVVLLVLIPVIGSVSDNQDIAIASTAPSLWPALGLAILKLGVFVAIIFVVGVRIIPWALVRVARLRSRELFTLTVLVFSIAIAAASYYFFGASMALGAFLAGMVVAQSAASHQAAADALPLRDAFAVIFFVSVGMLFDPAFLFEKPLMVFAGLAIVLLGKPLAALVIVAVLGHSATVALTVAIGLAQIGEFSFILSELAKRHGLMPEAGHNLLVATAIISMTLNPILFRSLPNLESWLQRRPVLWRLLNGKAEKRTASINFAARQSLTHSLEQGARLAIVIGYGPVGRSVHRLLREADLHTVVIDLNMDTVSSLNAEGQAAIFGDASHESILGQAGAQRAEYVLVTLPHSSDRAAVVTAVRTLNPTARILVRARYLREREFLEQSGATAAVFDEAEAAVALARLVLADTGIHHDAADASINDLRLQLVLESTTSIRSRPLTSVMVPWSRVRWLSKDADKKSVTERVSRDRFSRWPVVDVETGHAEGYVLIKDLFADAAESDWSNLVRPLVALQDDLTIEAALDKIRNERSPIYLVEHEQRPIGIITLEHVFEQIASQIGDRYRDEGQTLVVEALANGTIVLDLTSASRDGVIRELVHAIPAQRFPHALNRDEIVNLTLAREDQLSTDLGVGVAIPHARCPGLPAPVIVFGRSVEGVMFTTKTPKLVHLIFLIITPAEEPEVQLALLSQVIRLCGDPAVRDALMRANLHEDAKRIVTDGQ